MRVLIVADIYTHPHNMGNLQGLYRECCQMKKMGWEIDFLYWGNRLLPDFEAMQDFFGEEHIYFVNTSSPELKHQLRAFLRQRLDAHGITKYISVPYDVDERYYREIEDKVTYLDKKKEYDVVWLEYYLQSKIFPGLRKEIVKVIHTHDRFGSRNKIYQKVGRVPEFYYLTQKGERAALSRADIVIAVQDDEKEYFNALLKGTNTKSVTIGNLVEMKDSPYVKDKTVGFFGAVNDTNEFAVKWFIQSILPLVREKEPETCFIIAGGICKKVSDSDDYVKLGFVETLEEFYDKVKIVVGPLKNGTGLNIKNIEALSYKKPVVTTSVGAKGLNGAEKALQICDDEETFADAVICLLNDEEACKEMSRYAEEFIKGYIDRNVCTIKEIEKISLNKKKELE